MSDEAVNPTKAQRLALAAAEAPILRNASPKTLARRVALVDKDGNVTGYTSGKEVLKSLARVQELEHAVEDDVRPSAVICENCGAPVPVTNKRGNPPKICRGGCDKQQTCAAEGCDRRPGPDAFRPSIVRKRRGGPWICNACSLRSRTAEQHASAARKRVAGMTPDQRSEASRKAQASMAPGLRSTISKRRWETRRKNSPAADE